MHSSTNTTTPGDSSASGASEKPAAGVSEKPGANEPARRRGVSLGAIFFSFLLVAAVTVAAGSTFVAMQAIEERNELQAKYSDSTAAVNKLVEAVATSGSLKGVSNAKAREEIFAPAIEYYSKVASQTPTLDNPEALPEIASAKYHLAALQTKLGMSAGVLSLGGGADAVRMMQMSNMDPDRFPSLKTSALQLTAPMDWVMVKDSGLEAQATALLFTIVNAIGVYDVLSHKHPDVIGFRDDLSAIYEASGALQSRVPTREDFAIDAWKHARTLLQGLVQERPSDVSYQTRLAECLVGLGALEKKLGRNNDAIGDYKQAVELQQKMVEANPDDKNLAKALAKSQSDLEKIEPEPEATPQDAAAAPAADAPAEGSAARPTRQSPRPPPSRPPSAAAMVDQVPKGDASDRGRSFGRLLLLVAVAAALALAAFWLGELTRADRSQLLNPNDAMSNWSQASGAQKQATAELLVDRFQREGLLGPRALARLHAPEGRQAMARELVVELDAAANPDVMAYVSPGEPMARVASGAIGRLDWDE